MARKLYRNKTNLDQVIYDDRRVKRIIPPEGTIVLEPELAKRLSILAEVDTSKPRSKPSGKGGGEGEGNGGDGGGTGGAQTTTV